MSFPVPVKYDLTDNKNETVVIYNDGREEKLLPFPGCFSQDNINKFADAWISGNLGNSITLTALPNRVYAFAGSPFKQIFYMPKATIITRFMFSYSNTTEVIVIPYANIHAAYVFHYNRSLKKVDLITDTIWARTFENCDILNTIILRNKNIVSLVETNAFNTCPFAQNGSGGEIYIPKNLYDHLGDGSELDYKAAANWSTVDGYGTIAWCQIEGSEYEFNYADGTPIGSV